MAGRPGRRRRETYAERLERRASIQDPEVVLNSAAGFLEARSRSVAEVRRHLKGFPPQLVEGAIERLTALGMLDDAAFTRAWVESRDRARPRGEQALKRELYEKGVDRSVVAEVLEDRAGDAEGGADLEAAQRLLTRRGPALGRIADPRLRRQRAYSLLARNGFDPEVCREAVGRFGAELGEDGVEDSPG